MNRLTTGCILVDHQDPKRARILGRVIMIDATHDRLVLMMFPTKDKNGRIKNYVRAPQFDRLSSIVSAIDRNQYSVTSFEPPAHWLLTIEQIRHERSVTTHGSGRRKLRKWIRTRSRAYGRIRPFVHGRTVDQILNDPDFQSWPGKRAAELGLIGTSQVQRDLNAYLLGLGERNALLPWFSRCGAPNRFKYTNAHAGRPQEFGGDEAPEQQSKGLDHHTRLRLALGWRKHKKKGVSDQTAFDRTLEEFFSDKFQWDKAGTLISKVKQEAYQITLTQFRRWGKLGVDALESETAPSPKPVNHFYLRHMGTFSARNVTANGEALADSTSCDQSLVSVASRLKPLMSPWRTEIVGSAVGYCFGLHVGFESPSAQTALMAILNAAGSKVEFCRRYGIDITEDEWLPMVFRRYAMDNGEGKNKLTMSTIEELQAGVSYGSAYDAINKYLVESDHRRYQTHVDHHHPGSTFGRMKARGEPNRALIGILNFEEYMPRLIKRVLFHNNDEIIVPPRIEMRAAGPNLTRRKAIEWMISEGYMTSAPTDLTALKVKCLPQIKAVIHGDGVKLFDPTYSGNRLIPLLRYTSSWLIKSGLLDKCAQRSRTVNAHIDPSNLSEIWLNIDGLKHLALDSADPDLQRITLLDWLLISRDDRLAKFLSRVKAVDVAVQQTRSIKSDIAKAKVERKAEIEALPEKPSKTALSQDKRINTAIERAGMTGMPKIPSSKPPAVQWASSPPQRTSPPPPISISVLDEALTYADEISALRLRRKCE